MLTQRQCIDDLGVVHHSMDARHTGLNACPTRINTSGVVHHSMDACHTLGTPSVGGASWIECLPNSSKLITLVWCIIPWMRSISM